VQIAVHRQTDIKR